MFLRGHRQCLSSVGLLIILFLCNIIVEFSTFKFRDSTEKLHSVIYIIHCLCVIIKIKPTYIHQSYDPTRRYICDIVHGGTSMARKNHLCLCDRQLSMSWIIDFFDSTWSPEDILLALFRPKAKLHNPK